MVIQVFLYSIPKRVLLDMAVIAQLNCEAVLVTACL